MAERTKTRRMTSFQKVLQRLAKDKKAVLCGIILLAFLLVAIFSSSLTPNDPNEVHPELRLAEPSFQYPLGNDQLGRCILSRLIAGTSTTLGNALAVLTGILVVGVPLGMYAGFKGGIVDNIIMRLVDVLCTFPSSLVALAVVGILGPGLTNIMLVLVTLWWAPLARMVRGEVLQIKEKEFVTAARCSGLSDTKIVFRHVLLNIVPPVVVYATLRVGAIIMHIAGFSFIGLGTQAPMSDWGVMLSDAREYLRFAPRMMLWPGLCIMIVAFSLNVFGEGLGEALKPGSKNLSRKEVQE